MNILVFSPIEMPYTVGARYTGLERLAVQFAEQLAKQGQDVTLLAHGDTALPNGVKLLPCEGYINNNRTIHAEQKAFQAYQAEFYKYDVIWDIGHLHLIARYMQGLPTVNVFGANPQYEAALGNEKAPYNLISWSKWGIGQIKRYYNRDARYQETIMVDPDIYKPPDKRGKRFLSVGRMGPEKGNLNAVKLCQELNLPLDVAGGRGSEVTRGQPLTDYESEIKERCDDNLIIFLGEVSDDKKVELMQGCKGLLYVTDHTEITSHKVQEAMLCGAPVIIPNLGGMPEIATQGVDGYLCNTKAEYIEAIKSIDNLDPRKTHDAVARKYNPFYVTQGYIDLFEKVANGLRW